MIGSHVAIIGGGLAGLAAAESLSRCVPEINVSVIESKRVVGGRAGSYIDPDTSNEVDYCQHAAMGCCTNLIDMLTRCGLDHHLQRHRELTFLHPDHPPSRFAPSRYLPAPFHLLGTVFAQRYLSKRQKREIVGGLWTLMRTSPSKLQTVRAGEWLERAGQNRDTIRDFWDVILVSALGEQTDQVSMGAARKVMIDGFAIARGASDVLVPSRPLVDLFGRQLAGVLEERGVEILTGQTVQQISVDGEVGCDGTRIKPDCVICAVPWHQLGRLFGHWPETQRAAFPDLEAIVRIPSSPISGLHLWFDAPITDLDHAVMVGTNAQWLFSDPCGDRKSGRTDGSEQRFYYQVVISASSDARSISQDQLLATIVAELRHAFPAARDARLLKHRLVTDPKSVFSIRPEVEAIRPDCRTALPWLFLAGDWTRTLWPATMEGAVISGRSAAELVANQLRGNQAGSSHLRDSPHDGDFVCEGLKPGRIAKLLIRHT